MPYTKEQLETEKRRRGLLAEKERRAPKDYGTVFLPREKLPGAWEYDKQLDQLLGNNKYELSDLAPLDVKYRIGRVVGMTEKPDETKARMENSLYYSIIFNELPEVTYNLVDELNKIAFKKPIDVMKATRDYKDYYQGRKKYMASIEHGLKNLGVRLLQVPVGAAKMEAELGGKVRDWQWKTLLKRDKPDYLKKMDKTLADWSDTMYAAIGEYYRENKAEMVDILPGAGFVGTLREYAARPELFVQSLVESMGMVLEGTAGTLIGGPAGGIIAMGIPLSFEVYPDVRATGTEELPALAQSMFTGMGEAIIEQWTLSRKLGLMKNFKKYVSEGLPKMLWEGVKVYFRGTAEEGTQEFNRNFWNWVFTDRSQQWMDNVAESMAIGGPMELAMAGGFSAVGAATGTLIAKEQKTLRIDQIQEAVEKSPLSEEHKAEIIEELDTARFEADVAEMERELAEIQETAMAEAKPEAKAEPAKPIPAVRLRDGSVITGENHGEIVHKLKEEGKIDPVKSMLEEGFVDGWVVKGQFHDTSKMTSVEVEKFLAQPVSKAEPAKVKKSKPIRLTDESIVHPSARVKGKIQVTYFTKEGKPAGHDEYDTLQAALEENFDKINHPVFRRFSRAEKAMSWYGEALSNENVKPLREGKKYAYISTLRPLSGVQIEGIFANVDNGTKSVLWRDTPVPLSKQEHLNLIPYSTEAINAAVADYIDTIRAQPTKAEPAKVEERITGIEQKVEDLNTKLRQRIGAIAAKKGLTKKALSDLKLKHTGYRTLTGKISKTKITTDQLKTLLRAVEKKRPKQIGHKKVITQKTEKKIQNLKDNLIKREHLSQGKFDEILNRVIPTFGKKGEKIGHKEPRYISGEKFITEQEGKEIINRMHDASEIARAVQPYKNAIAKNPEIAAEVARLQSEIADKSKRDPWRTESMRYYAQQSEIKTGAPIFSMYMDLLDTNLEMHKTRHARILAMENDVPDFRDIASNEGSLATVAAYIASQSDLKDKPAIPKVTDAEKKLAQEIQKIAKEYEIKARVGKFFNWYNYGEGIAEYDQYKKEIHKAEDVYDSQGKEALIEYLKTQKWGVVKSGYEPLETFIWKIHLYNTGPKTVGKSHIKIRTDIEYHEQERNILQRLNAYMKQMDMLYNLSPKINALVRLYDDNMDSFSNPAKVKESIELFLRNLKRYNIQGEWFGNVMARIYAQASQIIIMAQPVLAFRNTFQNAAFEHDKSILFDPRNENLTKEETEYMETYVQQLRSMLEEYFMVNERSLPGTKTLMKMLQKIKIYAWSDVKNRQWGFWAKINQVKRALENKDVSEMMKEAKFSDMSELEQVRALGILAKDGKEAMARYVSRVHVDDIHFLYERAQRSPAEMGPLGRVFGNLMLFPRAYAEKLAHQTKKLTSADPQEVMRAAKVLTAVIVGGILTGELYCIITGRKRNPYNPLNILNFQLGGLMLGITEDVNETYNYTIKALGGDKKALYALTTILPRMSDTFIPFYDWTLRGIEATTGGKNLDRSALRTIYEAIDKEYKRRGDAYKMKRDLVQKLQYVFAGESVDIKIEAEKKKPHRVR